MRHERRGALVRAARAARVPVRFLDWREESGASRIPVHRYDTLLEHIEHTVSSLSAIAGAHSPPTGDDRGPCAITVGNPGVNQDRP